MAAIRKRTPAIAVFAGLVLAACAQPSGVGEEDESAIGMGGGVGTPGCEPESGCSACTGCIASCVCATGDKVGCVESCGPPGGPSPPPYPPPPSGGGGGPGEGGGGGPSGGGWGGGSNGGSPGGGGWGGGSNGGSGSGGTGGSGSFGGSTSGGGNGGVVNSGGGGTSNCVYPSGPYGTSVGKVLDPKLSWQGFVDGATTASTISITDYFDCDGKRGIHALFLVQSALWCGACKTEAQALNSKMSGGWSQKGIEVLVLIIQDNSGSPAQLKHAESWKNTYKAKEWSCAVDPAFTFKGPGSNGLPLGLVVDPRTMKVVDRQEGYDPYNSPLVNLATQNSK